MAHVCNFYCQDGWHAGLVLRTSLGEEEVRADYAALGYEVGRCWQAREVDLSRVRAQVTHGMVQAEDGTLTRRPVTPADEASLAHCTVVYIILVRRRATHEGRSSHAAGAKTPM